MVCRNICKKIYSEIVVRESHYSVEKRYCRRCECFFVTDKKFCQSCGMQLRLTPSEGEYKEEIGGKYDYHKYEESRRKKQLTW